MDKSTLLRFQGCTKTPSLFKTNGVIEFKSIALDSNFNALDTEIEFNNLRLGKLVEEFVFYQLKQQDSVSWIVENLQIQKDHRTIGELDALYYKKAQPIHLEVVYKFYLYDTLETYNDPLAYWIGPNRNDSLLYKLDKLRHKQFPLLYKTETRDQLTNYDINIDAVSQQLCYRAQLFLPYNNAKININPLNENCINGFFISFKAISILKDAKFYIPKKLDWLVIPHNDVLWKAFEDAKKTIQKEIESERSPLVWLKYSENDFRKCFITWW